MKQGLPGTVTYDYKRNGTTTLFAALDVATGQMVGKCFSRHRHEEFLAFLKIIDREVPKGTDIHIVLDNYATHKHPNVRDWLAKHKRFHLHFTSDELLVAEPGRALVPGHHHHGHTAGELRQRR